MIINTINLFEDNRSVICMTKNPQYNDRSKHVDIRYHFIRENIKLFCLTADMLADIFTNHCLMINFLGLKISWVLNHLILSCNE